MKKFQFSLDNVHRFKGQVLNGLLNEQAAIYHQIKLQQDAIQAKKDKINELNSELNEKNKTGINIQEMILYKTFLKRLQRELDVENKKLAKLFEELEQKKQEVIESKKENRSLDLLKEKKIEDYNKMVQKKEEIEVEEFVVNSIVAQRQ